MDEKQCEIYRQHLLEKVNRNEIRINDHSKRIDSIEQHNSRTDEKIENLIDKMDNLISTMRWGMGLLVGSFVSFFFYAVQHGLFK
ncbi:Haemolysin XhlA [Peptoniphilus asaccharolyticus DSM 20463]|uniref:Haemolysin XhlA n=1 Tax=Peptoniphilus asaccharolyticus DSM 20463 TaxID=573058 RepID=A0A1W1V1Y5_PEPAS|nr:hemolysin XhlA family protein [Peptoniphilus asaccharolyticus]MBL7575501.1 hemolysin XhlA family protein [Peptoniphilus asaccharolyticus]SMB87031.1 Haemolysin XhlA [Peptoniphilus asaccharolyticus DSM 20463]